MAPGRIGPLTEFLESVATAVGAGMLVGGFAIGSAAFIAGRSRQALAERTLTAGYLGGIAGAGAILIDIALRYGW